MSADQRFRIITDPVRGDLDLPEPDSTRYGDGPYILPIVDEVYGGVIAWANSTALAERIVAALSAEETLAEKLKEAEEYIAEYDVPGEWLDSDGSWKDWESEAEARGAEGTRDALAFALATLRGEKVPQ